LPFERSDQAPLKTSSSWDWSAKNHPSPRGILVPTHSELEAASSRRITLVTDTLAPLSS